MRYNLITACMKPNSVRPLVVLLTCVWLALMQPGVSVYWLIAPAIHARIDVDEYGQTPDGQPLPGRPATPPHGHPTSDAFPASAVSLPTSFDAAFYQMVFSPAQRPSLNGERTEASVIAESITPDPPDHPPRARLWSLPLAPKI
jgi:hypothetical protein